MNKIVYWKKSCKTRKLTEIQAKLLGKTATFFIGDGRRKGLVGISNQCSSYTRTVSCILMSTAGNSIPVHHVPSPAPGSSKPTSIYLHCLWINAMDWLENRRYNSQKTAQCSTTNCIILWDTCRFYKVPNTPERNVDMGLSVSGLLYQGFCNKRQSDFVGTFSYQALFKHILWI